MCCNGLSDNRRGFILVFSLWVLAFLTVLAVGVASGIGQKVLLLKKLDERARMKYVLDAAAATAKAYIRLQLEKSEYLYNVDVKSRLHNNVSVFSEIALGEDRAQISYVSRDGNANVLLFGVIDEERKININTASVITLNRLLVKVLGLRADDARLMAESILDWRKVGSSQAAGFFSDEYYANLQFPYKKKDGDYEILDELLLVKGMTKDNVERILPYVTIYGDGRININTAPAEVLFAIGVDDELIAKILTARRGKDGVEATGDDLVFTKTFDIAAELNAVENLKPKEAWSFVAFNIHVLLSVISFYFSINIQGSIKRSSWFKNARSVFSARENKILYWR